MTKDEALAGEPVTWGVDWSNVGDIPCVSIIKRLPDGGIEVLAVEYGPPQRPWVGLTDEERLRVLQFIDPKAVRFPLGFKQIAESIERLLKEKNA
ncbi:hypothetical protein UFOVP371_1 [uncultured Caudovirales phage]|uniref:Uncharacterized protein n=1 Tax=uncultured Caudovirales phage TaxID=2100421 RepID=A0A6J7WWN7_9CAUD|nr:hypothetical protein UFOVP371_1 [uncultured Caudovirales phage]